jgi:pimeloyl-ACP methyl ester carboxylesterase
MKIILIAIGVALVLYAAVCWLLYLKQESLLFFPQKLPPNYRFTFPDPFEERWITTDDGTRLHGLLFTTDDPKGLIFYLHGNAGSLAGWGDVAAVYTRLGYDVFMLDYRGYGKSGGAISSEKQLLSDAEAAYEAIIKQYPEEQIVVLGYSLGTGLAAWLAAHYQPRLLILQAPYYSFQDLATHFYPLIPGVLLRYPMRTHNLLPQIKAPIVLIHGDQDEVVYYGSSLKLKPLLKPTDRLITLPGIGHNGMTETSVYQILIRNVLSTP